ncbi:hypothetical protein GXM_06163 [Nostoc sphaeroides CCNUC1]|uniref:Uncharacterized protein n=1 Tax=Nostoc sphaeroides CCNUC1 TaxID=2653204 RepID=A0A5P8W9N0_9NOSO|nr:hypothetical protein GXM_06163 [Nostoc sphaeroides CCNUC1]
MGNDSVAKAVTLSPSNTSGTRFKRQKQNIKWSVKLCCQKHCSQNISPQKIQIVDA